MTTKQITVLEQQVTPVVSQAQLLSITSTESLTSASELRENIKRVQKDIEADKEELYRPAKMVLDEINARYKPFEAPLKEALKIVNEKMSAYQTAEVARAKAEADKIAARIGVNLGVEKAMEKIDEIEKPATLEATGFVNKPELLIEDESLLPRQYLMPNEKMIFEALKDGAKIPGAKIVDKFIPRTR